MVNTFSTKQANKKFHSGKRIHFFEAHSASEDATKQIEQDLDIVDKIMHDLCIPVIKAKDLLGIHSPAPGIPLVLMPLCQMDVPCKLQVATIIATSGQSV